MSNFIHRLRSFFFVILVASVIAGCLSQPTPEDWAKATKGYSGDINDLFVINCAFPGRIKQLGDIRYLEPRRPMKTTAGDCRTKGGEFVLYDRMNRENALQVWLDLATKGDAKAQLYVGQIYENGVGQPPNFGEAAKWYRKSAEQGNSQARINLGLMYEEGKGISKDSQTAINLYRQASGLDALGIEYVPAAAGQEAISVAENKAEQAQAESERLKVALEKLTQENAGLKDRLQESEKLRHESRSLEQRLIDQQKATHAAQEELERVRQSINQSAGDGVDAFNSELKKKGVELEAQQQRLTQMTLAFDRERQALRKQVETAWRRLKESQIKPAEVASKVSSAHSELVELETKLDQKLIGYKSDSEKLTKIIAAKPNVERKPASGLTNSLRKKIRSQTDEIIALKNKVEIQNSRVTGLETAASTPPKIIITNPLIVSDASSRGADPRIPELQVAQANQKVLGKIEATDKVRLLTVNGQPQSVQEDGSFQVSVLNDWIGQNIRFSAVDASDRKGELIVYFRSIATTDGDRTKNGEVETASATRIENQGDMDFGRYIALIIGNNNYQFKDPLVTAVDDAKAVNAVLKQKYGFITKLLLNADRAVIMSQLNQLRNQLTEKDNLLIYYAGHGALESGKGYWLPVDAKPNDLSNWISNQSITEVLDILPARHILVVADSCYSGTLVNTSAIPKLPNNIDNDKRNKWLRAMVGINGRTALTSGGEEPVIDRQGASGHSVFAQAFISILASNQRILEDFGLFNQLRTKVHNVAPQNPHYGAIQHSGHQGSAFFFVPKA